MADQVGCPSSTLNLAGLLEGDQPQPGRNELHQCCIGVMAEQPVGTTAVAVGELAVELGLLKQAAKVNPISTADYPTPATRPVYSLLDYQASRAAESGGPALAYSAQGCAAGNPHQLLIAMTNPMSTAAELLESHRRVLVQVVRASTVEPWCTICCARATPSCSSSTRWDMPAI